MIEKFNHKKGPPARTTPVMKRTSVSSSSIHPASTLNKLIGHEAEMMIVRTALTYADQLPTIIKHGITAESFDHEPNRLAWQSIVQLHEQGREINEITLTDQLRENGTFDAAGGIAYVTAATDEKNVSIVELPRYCEKVAAMHHARKANDIADRIKLMISDGNEAGLLQALDDAAELRESTGTTAETIPFADWEEVFNSDLEREQPTIGKIDGWGFLLYSGRINECHAEPGLGKSILALSIVAQLLREGKRALIIDPEDTAKTAASRLLSFGVTQDQIAAGLKYVSNPDPVQLMAVIRWTKANPVALVVLDGLAEVLAALGIDEDKPGDLLPFFAKYIRPAAESGAAVLISDHVVKSTESRGRWARGSGAKMGRYDGAVYELRPIAGYSPDKAGGFKLVLSKDRNGGVGAIGSIVAEVKLSPRQMGGTTVEIVKPDQGDSFRPTELMKRVFEAVTEYPDISKRRLRCLGKSQYIDQAIDQLIVEGYISHQHGGVGTAGKYVVNKEFKG